MKPSSHLDIAKRDSVRAAHVKCEDQRMKIAVIGPTGYIGSRLVERGHYAVPRSSSWRALDADVVVYAAGYTRVKTERDAVSGLAAYAAHVRGAALLAEWCAQRPKRRVVYLSSMHVYRDENPSVYDDVIAPDTVTYAGLKRAAELVLFTALNSLDPLPAGSFVILRLAHVYGAGIRMDMDGVVHKFARAAMWGKSITFPFAKYDVVHLDDVCDAIERACVSGTGIFNIGGDGVALHEIAMQCMALRPASGTQASFTGEVGRSLVLDTRRAYAYWGWTPRVPLAEGILGVMKYLTEKRL